MTRPTGRATAKSTRNAPDGILTCPGRHKIARGAQSLRHQGFDFPGRAVTFAPMMDPYFFGYGSLVNSATHDFTDIHAARARGWRRAWRHTDLRPVSFLTVVPDAQSTIDGVIATVPGADWAALDLREGAYDRVPASDQVEHGLDPALDIAIYAIPANRHAPPTTAHPILMSYLDCVFQGYLHRYGWDGVTGFIATTDGWHAPILDDRDAPRYPRHQPIDAEDRSRFNDLLTDVGARILMSLA